VNNLLRRIYGFVAGKRFSTSSEYWQRRYLDRGNSGSGSYGRLAHFKAAVLNDLVKSKGVESVLEFGCGDGAQLALASYPIYLGVDVSPAAVDTCKARFAGDQSKSFMTLDSFRQVRPTADLGLSLDVIYHLVEDQIFDEYMRDLFGASKRLVAVYSSNSNAIADPAPHVRHRAFTDWVVQHATDWRLVSTHRNPYPHRWYNRKNTSPCDFYVFEKQAG
jgi:SAM-dependent methyltransferase